MATNHAQASYREAAAATATPAQLVMMLYDGAIAHIDRAQRALTLPAAAADANQAHEPLVKAQAIIDELRLALDHDAGGPIATQLDHLYQFCAASLIEANVRKDAGDLAAIRQVLATLRDTWSTACLPSLAHEHVRAG